MRDLDAVGVIPEGLFLHSRSFDVFSCVGRRQNMRFGQNVEVGLIFGSSWFDQNPEIVQYGIYICVFT